MKHKDIKIPYGESDYKKIKQKKCLYIDKTKFITELERLDTDYPVVLRPRRFGKSLFVSTLFYYYDINSGNEFEELFSDTYIGKHKTELANQYYVLRFDFSGLNTESEEQLKYSFYSRVLGSLRTFYEIFKSHTTDGCIDRIFITGVTSMTLDSLTSGFNIAKNVSMYPLLNEMIGFTADETQDTLQLMGIDNIDYIMDLLIEHYNGYIFCDSSNALRVLNSNLVLYFLSEYKIQNTIPDRFIDGNIRSDYQKLTQIFELFQDESKREEILQKIMEGKSIAANIVTDFSFTTVFKKNEFLSMLYYLGLLTIKGSGGTLDVTLETPNAVIRDIYSKYYMEYLRIDEEIKLDAVGAIAFSNDFTKFNNLIEHVLRNHSNDDYRYFKEAALKSVFLSCLSDQKVYLVKSEYESSGKKPDIALLDIRGGRTSVKNNYLIELKYLPKSIATESKINEKIEEARIQMQTYLNLPEFEKDNRMKGMIYVIVKDKIICFEEVKTDQKAGG